MLSSNRSIPLGECGVCECVELAQCEINGAEWRGDIWRKARRRNSMLYTAFPHRREWSMWGAVDRRRFLRSEADGHPPGVFQPVCSIGEGYRTST